jgi:stage III sporulation protein AA
MRKNHPAQGDDTQLKRMGYQVGVCDERSEISGMYNGRLPTTLDSALTCLTLPERKGMIMLIRSMSPDLIATDEIGKQEDCRAVEAAVCAGISLQTTIHGNSYEDVRNSSIGSWWRRASSTPDFFIQCSRHRIHFRHKRLEESDVN